MKLLVAISSYRVADLTIDCLRSLRAEVGRIPGTRVVVCENGSGGDEADRLRRAIEVDGWGSWADLIAVHPNRGFTGGTNAAIRRALEAGDLPEYFLLLNADTIVQEDALGSLVEFMDGHPRAGIAGSRLLWPDGKVGASPFRFPGIATELDRGLQLGVVSRLLRRWSIVMPTPETPCRSDWVSGASMILRRAMLDEIGLLDEGFFTYFDDPDICLRARRAGWETWHVPRSRVVHLVGSSTEVGGRGARPRRPRYWHQARRRYFLKHHGALYAAAVDAAYLTGLLCRRARRRLQLRPDTDPPHLLGDSLRHSVFLSGFRLRAVENPALHQPSDP